VYYRKERFERLDEGTFWLSTTPDKVGSKGWDAALPRVCSWLKLRDKTSGGEFYIFNTHFDHRGELARKLSAALLRVKLPEIAGESPLLLTGDFNCTSSDAAYKTLTTGKTTAGTVAGEPLEDARDASAAKAESPDSTWNGFHEIVPGRRIDFIFVRRVAVHSHRVLDPRVKDRFLSDHLPVVAGIAIAGGKK
jgi:endonuclease/exonuclease/phosphatase family metal-dependent hydrolase